MNAPLKIAICEDSADDAQLLINCIRLIGMPAAWDLYESGEALLSAFLPGKYDLIFLDIYMGGMAGVEAARSVRNRDGNVVLAFTTSSDEHTRESYRLGALKYIIKPVAEKDVAEAMRLADMARRERKYISLLTGGRHVEIPLDTILYFEVQDHAVLIHTSTGTLKASQAERLAAIELLLPCPPFLRCHHSYIVNLNYVQSVEQDFVLSSGDRVHIRQRDLKKHTDAYKSWLLDKLGKEV